MLGYFYKNSSTGTLFYCLERRDHRHTYGRDTFPAPAFMNLMAAKGVPSRKYFYETVKLK